MLVLGWAMAADPAVAQDPERRLEVRGLSFEGNRAIDDFTLRISIATSQSAWLARLPVVRGLGLGTERYFDETEFRRDVFRLLLLYRRTGFIEAQVDTIVDRGDSHVDVTFMIDEGQPVRVDTLEVDGTEGVMSSREMLRLLPLRVGDPFDRARLTAASDTIRSVLQNRGYPFPEVFRNFEVDNAARRASVRFVVDPGALARIDSVLVVGPPGVDESLVRSVVRMRPGSRFEQQAMYRSQQDLYRLGVYDFVDVRLADTVRAGLADSLVDVIAQVSRGRLHLIRAGGGIGTTDCIRTLTRWTLRNFLGGGRTLDLGATFSKIGTGSPFNLQNTPVCGELARESGTERLKLNYNLTAGVRFPTVLSSRRSATVTLSAERFSEFQAFVRSAVGLNVSVTQQTAADIPITFSYSLSYGSTDADDAVFCSFLNVCLPDDVEIFQQDRLKATAGVRLVRDRTDSPINPTRGTVLTLEGRLASPVTGSDSIIEFAKGLAELASYHPIGRRSVLAWRIRWGSIRSPDLRLARQDVLFVPTEERFYGGGPNTQRGFRQNEMGPVVFVEEVDLTPRFDPDSITIVREVTDIRVSPTGGNQMAFANVEYRFPIGPTGRLGGVFFADAGRVVAATPDTNQVDLRLAVGAGLRIFTPLGPVRLDLAYNPHGPESGRLYTLQCYPQPDGERVCEDQLILTRESFEPERNGLFGLDFLQGIRLNFSIGQAF